MVHRRDFLLATGGTGLVAWGADVPTFLSRAAAATPRLGASGAKDTILVVVQLTGGNDGLNTVVPYRDPLYAENRPTLQLPVDQLKKMNDDLGLHPELEGFAKLLEDRALCVVQGVGYPNPNQSHFVSMDIWHTANLRRQDGDGWLGRALARMPAGKATGFHVAMPNESSPLAVAGAPVKVPSLTRLEDFQLRTVASSAADRQAQKQLIETPRLDSPPGSLLDFVHRTSAGTFATTNRLREIAKNYSPRTSYPATGLAERLRLTAQLIDAEVGARVYYVSLDGWDTHANQAPDHARLLGELSGAVTAFFQDLSARGQRDRVLLLTFSEFGRRVRENGSKGTDHGAGAPVFLVGGKVRAGVVGSHPPLDQLEDGNLKHHFDFRQIYAAILDGWLGVSSRDVLGSVFTPVPIWS